MHRSRICVRTHGSRNPPPPSPQHPPTTNPTTTQKKQPRKRRCGSWSAPSSGGTWPRPRPTRCPATPSATRTPSCWESAPMSTSWGTRYGRGPVCVCMCVCLCREGGKGVRGCLVVCLRTSVLCIDNATPPLSPPLTQDGFATSLVTGPEGQRCRVVCVPAFHKVVRLLDGVEWHWNGTGWTDEIQSIHQNQLTATTNRRTRRCSWSSTPSRPRPSASPAPRSLPRRRRLLSRRRRRRGRMRTMRWTRTTEWVWCGWGRWEGRMRGRRLSSASGLGRC